MGRAMTRRWTLLAAPPSTPARPQCGAVVAAPPGRPFLSCGTQRRHGLTSSTSQVTYASAGSSSGFSRPRQELETECGGALLEAAELAVLLLLLVCGDARPHERVAVLEGLVDEDA